MVYIQTVKVTNKLGAYGIIGMKNPENGLIPYHQ